MQEFGMAYRQKVAPDHVGVHRSNRGGTGLVASSVHSLMEFILANGWSWRKVVSASAVEVAPGDRSADEFQKAVVAAADGMLGASVHELKIVTLECSHTTACLNAVLQGAKAVHDTIADSEGRFFHKF